VTRRLHAPELRAPGAIALDAGEAHHARDVLRLRAGDAVDLFDDAGRSARGTIETCSASAVVVRVGSIDDPRPVSGITIASAIPKGERADWMIEKLSELGVDRFIPLHSERSIVLPAGKNKRDRWIRIATEAAKQSRRRGVMRIDELTPLAEVLRESSKALSFHLSTEPNARSIHEQLQAQPTSCHARLLVGPEGGWTDAETRAMRDAGLTGVKLTETILRVETAAIAGAAIVCTWRAAHERSPSAS
jgi:16S rRNA (uracil1498-N3)-methyltransferase